MDAVHRILGYVVVLAVGIGIAWSLVATRNADLRGRSFPRFQAVVVGVFVVASVAGLGMLLSGGQPKESLHLVYAAIAIVLLPLARSFVPAIDRRSGIAALAAFVVLGGVVPAVHHWLTSDQGWIAMVPLIPAS